MKSLLIIVLLFVISGCASTPEVFQQSNYAALPKAHLHKLQQWKFDGRFAITSKNDSWSANVKWQHKAGVDRITLSGLLGQGATLIELKDGWVAIDNGKGPIEQSNDPDAFVSQELGVFVPVKALASWVIGLPSPSGGERLTLQGFMQDGWDIGYKEWLKQDGKALPHKLNVKNDQVKLKLVIEHWNLD